VGISQLGLKVEPARSRQADIEDQATDRVAGFSLQVLPGGAEHLALQVDGLQQRFQTFAHIIVVVHHEYYLL